MMGNRARMAVASLITVVMLGGASMAGYFAHDSSSPKTASVQQPKPKVIVIRKKRVRYIKPKQSAVSAAPTRAIIAKAPATTQVSSPPPQPAVSAPQQSTPKPVSRTSPGGGKAGGGEGDEGEGGEHGDD